MSNLQKFLRPSLRFVPALLLLFSVVPSVSLAWSPGQPLIPNACFTNPGGCGWNEIVFLGQNFLHIALYLASIAVVVSITYAGWLYITSQGNSSQISKAHGIFTKVAIGLFFMLGAWLIVSEVLKLLLNPALSGYSLLE